MTFGGMYGKMIEIVRERVANGEISESRLARVTGISQPHLHNALKGVRTLSTSMADEILSQLMINAEDLCGGDSPFQGRPFSPVPLLMGTLGPEMREFQPSRINGSVLVPSQLTAVNMRQLVATRLGDDPLCSPRFQKGDLVLVDLAAIARTRLAPAGAYVVSTPDGPRIRYVRVGDGQLYIPSEQCLETPAEWKAAPLKRKSMLELVRGRVVWLSRGLDN